MHKGVILIIPAKDRSSAEKGVRDFLEEYDENGENPTNRVYDWYEIGGRWKGTLPNGNVCLLKDCMAIVKDWRETVDEYIQKTEKYISEIVDPVRDKWSVEYNLELIEKAKEDIFFHNSNVYLITKEVNIISKSLFPNGFGESNGTHNLPDSLLTSLAAAKNNPEDYYCVMIDMHY